MSPSREYAGYLYIHFKRESVDGEQIHFALSDGNDPLHFDDLNGGKPVLYSTLGECGVRDPHIVRCPDGERFYMIATDLRVYACDDWERLQRRGSRSIMVSGFSETSPSLTAVDWKPLAEGIGLDAISRGEGPLAYRSNTEDKWFLWLDEFTPERRYVPFETTNLAGGQWTPSEDFRLPKDPCHAVVLPVTAEEYGRLSAAWGSADRS
jgi:hypothetical protein